MQIVDKSILDRSWPRLPTTASGVAQQGTCRNYTTASKNKTRKRGGRQVKRQQEVQKERHSLIRVGTLTHLCPEKQFFNILTFFIYSV